MPMQFSQNVYLECKAKYVQEGMNISAIARAMNKKPSAATIALWRDGHKWDDERKNWQQENFELISPPRMVAQVMRQMLKIVSKKDFNTRDGDALAKLQKIVSTIASSKYQVPIMYQFLTEFVAFAKTHYPRLVNEDFANCARDFRTELRQRLG